METPPNRIAHVYAGVNRWQGGAVGGVFRLAAGDDRWEHLTNGIGADRHVQAVTVDQRQPDVVYVATDDGVYRSRDRGDHWQRLNFPEAGVHVWSVLIHPTKPQTIFAGTAPLGLFRSDDGGESWRRMPQPQIVERIKAPFKARVMRLAADPAHPDDLYAVMEINGVMRSSDGGETWEDCNDGLLRLADEPHLKSALVSGIDFEGMLDGHAMCVSAAKPETVFVALRMGLFRSTDRGATWQDMEVGRFSPLRYARDVRVSPQDPNVMYACLSIASHSDAGSLYRSRDLGATWERFDHSVNPHHTVMAVATHPHDPGIVFSTTRDGKVFGTYDGGQTFGQFPMPEGCDGVYSLACG